MKNTTDATTEPRKLLLTATLKAITEKYKKMPALDQTWLICQLTNILSANPPGWQRRGNFNKDMARSIREKRGLTQATLARQTGVALTNLCRYETGKSIPRGNSSGSKNYLAWLAENGYKT